MEQADQQFMQSIIRQVINKEDLNGEIATECMRRFVGGRFTPAQLGCLMAAFRSKGETPTELGAFLRVYREGVTKVDLDVRGAVDMCGTGGDGLSANMFNISTTAAFVVAGSGVPVAKHGTVAVSSKSGSTDVLRQLGVAVDIAPSQIATLFERTGFCYMHGPSLNRAMANVIGPRRECAMRSFFNLLGPMSNPAGVKRQVVGVYSKGYTSVVAEAMRMCGSERVMVVSSDDSLDELSICGSTTISELENGEVTTRTVEPEELIGYRADPKALEGGTPDINAQICQAVLSGGATREQTDVVVVNAAASILVAGKVGDYAQALELARESVRSGKALAVLENVRRISKEFE